MNITGTPAADTLTGTSGDDVIQGGDGNDTIEDLLGGSDVIEGQAGDDLVHVFRGSGVPIGGTISIDTGDGNDTVSFHGIYTNTAVAVTISLGQGHDYLWVGDSSQVNIDAGGGNDYIHLELTDMGAESYLVKLGDGRDTILVGGRTHGYLSLPDFNPGQDRLDLFNLVPNPSINPFATGYLSILPGAMGVDLWYDSNGGGDGYVVIAQLPGITTDYSALALGWNPNGGATSGVTMTGSSETDRLVGLAGNDVMYGLAGNDQLWGGPGDDTIYGGAGADIIYGDDGHNVIWGEDGSDFLYGGSGPDDFVGGAGADWLQGSWAGDAVDTAWYFNQPDSGPLIINMRDPSKSTGDAQGDYFLSIERIVGSEGRDIIWGLDTTDYLNGRGGDDDFVGGGGGDGFDGGDGVDTVWYFNSPASGPLIVDLLSQKAQTGEAAGDVFTSVERIVATDGWDILWGTAHRDYFNGQGGNDDFVGRGGGDVFDGGAGVDSVWYYDAAPVGQYLVIDMIQTERSTYGAAGDQYVSVERIVGSEGSDYLFATQGGDVFSGGGGNDVAEGRGGADLLDGGAGDDRLAGGLGADTLVGGAGGDAFIWFGRDEGGDRIADFQSGVDHLELISSAFFGDPTGYLSAARFTIGTAAVGANAQLIWDAGAHTLSFDADGAGGAASILLAQLDNASLVASDIWLI